jgi:hypothetical protein
MTFREQYKNDFDLIRPEEGIIENILVKCRSEYNSPAKYPKRFHSPRLLTAAASLCILISAAIVLPTVLRNNESQNLALADNGGETIITAESGDSTDNAAMPIFPSEAAAGFAFDNEAEEVDEMLFAMPDELPPSNRVSRAETPEIAIIEYMEDGVMVEWGSERPPVEEQTEADDNILQAPAPLADTPPIAYAAGIGNVRVIIDQDITQPTAEELELIYEDEYYEYYLSSISSHLITITFEDGLTVSLKTALEQDLISMQDLILNGLSVIVTPKTH